MLVRQGVAGLLKAMKFLSRKQSPFFIKFISFFQHEECSIQIFKLLIKRNELRREIEKYLEKLNVDDFIKFIEDLIQGDDRKVVENKKFLFQVSV